MLLRTPLTMEVAQVSSCLLYKIKLLLKLKGTPEQGRGPQNPYTPLNGIGNKVSGFEIDLSSGDETQHNIGLGLSESVLRATGNFFFEELDKPLLQAGQHG